MRIFAVANQKGGVGKTTTAVTLGGLLCADGGRVLLVDVDPHGSLTAYFGFDPETVPHGVYGLFQQAVASAAPDASRLVRSTSIPGLDVLPANTALATLDRQLGARSGMGLVLARGLKPLAGRYDVVLMDCPPMLGVLMVNALAAAERLLIPVQTEFLALRGLDRMVNTLRMVQRSRRSELDYLIVPTLFDRRTRAAHEALSALRATHGIHVWRDVIPVDTKFRDASSAGQPLNFLVPEARGVIAYRALLHDLGWRGGARSRSAPTSDVGVSSVTGAPRRVVAGESGGGCVLAFDPERSRDSLRLGTKG